MWVGIGHLMYLKENNTLWQINLRIDVHSAKKLLSFGAFIAQWIRLRLPSCHPRFESQAYSVHFYHFLIVACGLCSLLSGPYT